MALKKPETVEPQFIDDEQPELATLEPSCAACQDEGTIQGCKECGAINNDASTQLASLGDFLMSKFTDVERKRQPIEQRWLEDLRQFHGRYDSDIENALRNAESCALFLNITKPKTQSFAARIMDMVLPTDEKNWGLEITPVPEIAGLASGAPDQPASIGDLTGSAGPQIAAPSPDQEGPAEDVQGDEQEQQGPMQGPPGSPPAPAGPEAAENEAAPGEAQQDMNEIPDVIDDGMVDQILTTPEGNVVLKRDLVAGVEAEAKARCQAMEDEIDDQLSESEYNAIQRKAIDQMAKLGTGVVMGPVIVDEYKVVWQPMPNPRTGKTDFVRKLVPNTDKRPGVQWVDLWNVYPDMSTPNPEELEFCFIQHLINKVTFLKYAKRFNFIPEQVKAALEAPKFNAYTLSWLSQLRDLSETNNQVDERYRLLRYLGDVTYEDLEAVGMDPESMGIDEDDVIRGVVWLCEGIVLKIDLNPLDSGELPLSWCYCDKDEASIFGRGIPRLMRGEQESVNSVWRMKHDNAGLSVAPQIFMRLNAVTPADGDYHLKPKKIWYIADDVGNVNNVMSQFPIDSHQAELNDLLQLGIRFADDVTMMPLIMQGDMAPHITQTAQGMSLLYNASTVVLRRSVKLYDDCLTVPLINRMYEWNMQFSDREDIKGDFRALARGSSSLLDKEQQAQALQAAMQFAMSPAWQPYTDMKKLYKEALKGMRIPDILASDDQIKAALAQQQEVAMAQAKSGKGGMDPQEAALQSRKLDIMEQGNQLRASSININQANKQAELASKERIAANTNLARTAVEKVKQSGENMRANADAQIKLQMGTGI